MSDCLIKFYFNFNCIIIKFLKVWSYKRKRVDGIFDIFSLLF